MVKLVERIKQLDRKKLFLLILIVIILVLFGATEFMKKASKEGMTWNCAKVTSAKDIIPSGELIYDRVIYWQLKQIIDQYANSYMYNQDEETKKIAKAPYEDYYGVLTKDYKKLLNKNKYMEKAKVFFDKMVLETDSPSGFYEENANRISRVLLYDDNMYLCEIEGTDENFPDFKAYIGIKLDNTKNKFSIFYIE